ncbi:hypothetical protein MHW47_06365 [Streptomyces sp. OfavH-34-F]|uniref:hypothetical protein n=1 Tax=Streptomyces sp. OfavH-34-F TaxID=2917760 RepID=UPI001EF1CD81|nr:hypothetical protein [Streptomyces sp. OfavH-34-F]MCG7524066.1 hypothetical protein [Streptomyces sp. OfavH-34-F]
MEKSSEQELRDALTESLIELGAARSPRVIAAFRNVLRHLATPHADLASTYDAEVATSTGGDRARIEVHPAGTPDDRLPAGGRRIERRHSRISITWP